MRLERGTRTRTNDSLTRWRKRPSALRPVAHNVGVGSRLAFRHQPPPQDLFACPGPDGVGGAYTLTITDDTWTESTGGESGKGTNFVFNRLKSGS